MLEVMKNNLDANGIINFYIDIILGGNSDKIKALKEMLIMSGRFSDLLLWNNFDMFLNNGDFKVDKLRKLSEILEESGNQREYAVRIWKAIENIDSPIAARCLSNLTESLINSEIDYATYFRLTYMMRQLLAEDLAFLSREMKPGVMMDNPHLDEFLVSGVLNIVNGGYEYTRRAWELKKHGIDRGHQVNIPENLSDRLIELLVDC